MLKQKNCKQFFLAFKIKKLVKVRPQDRPTKKCLLEYRNILKRNGVHNTNVSNLILTIISDNLRINQERSKLPKLKSIALKGQ